MINLVVAIPCEAKPLIQHLHLQKQAGYDYDLYQGEGINLIVCGVGKLAAAMACAWLQGLRATSITADNAWLNIGIAGHGYQPLGSGFLAHRISEQNNDRCWYPGFSFKRPCPSAALVTVNAAEFQYPDDALYDMEGTGFFTACQRFSSVELIHCFKVVSDNQFSSIENINEANVSELIRNQLPTIDDIIECLRQSRQYLARFQEPPPFYADCLQRWHFTHYQRKQLHQLLWRRQALLADIALPDEFARLRDAGQALNYLQQDTDRQPVAF
jgi:hypothetical protein